MMNVKRLIPTFHARTVRVLNAWRPEGVGMYEPAQSRCSSSNTMLMTVPFRSHARTHTPAVNGAYEIDAKPWLSRLALDILGHSIFNYDLGALPSPRVGDTDAADSGAVGYKSAAEDKQGAAAADGGNIMEAYYAFFEAAGDVRAAAVPYYDSWPFEYVLLSSVPSCSVLLAHSFLHTHTDTRRPFPKPLQH